MPMKKLLIVTVIALCALSASVGMTQDSNPAATTKDSALNAGSMQQFIRTVRLDGITLSFVLLNNKTVDFLFSGAQQVLDSRSGKYGDDVFCSGYC